MENIMIKKYDENNLDHKYITVSLDNDEQFHKFVGDTYYLIADMEKNKQLGLDDQIYIAYVDDEPIGLLEHNTLNDNLFIKIGIIPSKRGNHYGQRILAYFINYLFAYYPNLKEIYFSINPQNTAIIKTFLSLGFKSVNKFKYVKER